MLLTGIKSEHGVYLISKRPKMDLFQNLVANAPVIAEKTGVSPDKIRSISSTLQAKLNGHMALMDAVEATANEHGIRFDQFHEILVHAGSDDDLTGNLGSLFSGLIKRQIL
jgi:hypothetical protein